MRIFQVSKKARKRVEIVCLVVIIFTTISLFSLPVIFHHVKVSFPDEFSRLCPELIKIVWAPRVTDWSTSNIY